MKNKMLLHAFVLSALIGTGMLLPSFASAASNSFSGQRVTVTTSKPFDQVVRAVQSLVAKNGMMVMAQVDQGKMLSMTGLSLQAKLFLIGNPVVGKTLFSQDHGVGLYVPLGIFVYSNNSGKTFISYDKPSSLLSQFNNPKISMAAGMLNQKLAGLAHMAAQ
jgi:uncharacterized protein (DUF302 family)